MTNLSRLFQGFALAAASLSPALLRAEVKPAALFSDHMVFQRDAGAWVWGRADKGEPVSVRFGDQTARAVTDDEGRWSCRLDKVPPTGGPYELAIQGKENTAPVVLRDVAVGDVWVCSGQSNMEWTLAQARDGQAEIAAADHPRIRLFTVAKHPAADPEGDVTGTWTRCAPEAAGKFSAVGYFFGRELQAKLPGNVPIGLIHSSWGGTPAETWTPLSALRAEPELAPMVENWQKASEDFARARVEHGPVYTRWKDEADRLQAAGQPVPMPKGPPKPTHAVGPWAPASLYNGMIAPLIPHGIKGVIWYQGESNADRAKAYRKLLPTMISSWRRTWGEGDFPFLVVQLANFQARRPQPSDSNWAELREAQMLTAQRLPNTGIAVTVDIGEANTIHPLNKQDVGHRLALVAEHGVYGMKDVVSHGPIFAAAKPEAGGRMRVTFLPASSPLTSHGENGQLRGFAVAGADKKFAWAEARIEGDAVVVSSPLVPEPAAVRYAWAENPEADLFNAAGLPAGSFRSDDWAQSGTLAPPAATPAP